jgi:hypothetical protein
MTDALDRIHQYLSLQREAIKIKGALGEGTDGAVWATDSGSAIKAFWAERGYFNERDTYLRLAEWNVTKSLDGFWIPQMYGYNDELMVVEMDLMQRPPYIIDFAKVKIDRPPDFSEEVLAQADKDGREMFGEDWPAVQSLMRALESDQIYYLDPKPHSIVCR